MFQTNTIILFGRILLDVYIRKTLSGRELACRTYLDRPWRVNRKSTVNSSTCTLNSSLVFESRDSGRHCQ